MLGGACSCWRSRTGVGQLLPLISAIRVSVMVGKSVAGFRREPLLRNSSRLTRPDFLSLCYSLYLPLVPKIVDLPLAVDRYNFRFKIGLGLRS